MPNDRSPGAPDALGATMSSGPHHARAKGEAQPSRPDALQVSDIGDTFTPASERLLIAASGEVSTRREPVVPVSGIDQTAVGAPSQSVQPSADRPKLEDVIFDRRGEPGRIQRFEVLRQLGAGGMGVVYAAYDWELERRLAIKVMRDDSMTSEAGKRRILREAQAMAKVSHPNVVQVYEVGTWAEQIFVAMEYVKGKSLSDWLHAEERTWQEILEMYVQAGRGLAAAHRQGVVHRDFKPANVLVDTDGRARVLDFGLARAEGIGHAADSETALIGHRHGGGGAQLNLTMAGAIMGTPAFMSPEQHQGRLADARSDQFSFCVALYVGLYNQPPFAGETLIELGMSVTTGDLRPPPADTGVPAWVFAALQTGLATNPADRYPSMDTLLAAVSPETVADPQRRWVWPAALVGVTVLAVFITLYVVGGADATGEDLEAIARLEREAHDAAARRHWVYPGHVDPRDTAYNRVVLLEHLEGPAAPRGLSSAASLRAEFASDLVVLGDRYFDDPRSRPYARDYYAQALVFMPYDPRASDRARASIGQLADLAERAAAGDFSDEELFAVEPLRILADPDPVTARADALALAADPEFAEGFEGTRLARMFHSKGLLTDDEMRPDKPPEPEPEPTLLARAEPEPPPEPVALPEPVVLPEPPTKGGRKPKPGKPGPPPADPIPTVVPVPEEDMSAKLDPEASKSLSGEADAARKRGDAAAAETLYNKALDLWNGNAAALIGLSDLAFERGNFDRAVKYAEKAVRADAGNRDYQFRLGDAYFKVFRYTDAQQRYQKAADLGHPKAAERLARVQDKLGG